MLSYWEQSSFTKYDIIIAGAGIVGLSAAIELRDRMPAANILVLERGFLPTGASTRNAGFACMGSVTELLDDLETMSEIQVKHLFSWRKKGLELLRQRLGDEQIGYHENGSYELISEKELDAIERIDYLNDLLADITGKPAFKLADEHIDRLGFNADTTRHLIANTCEGELDSGKMMRALTLLTLSKGIEIRTGVTIVSFADVAGGVDVLVKDSFRNEEIGLRGGKFIICTNAFTKALLPDENVIPGRGQVLITDPIPNLKFKGIYHFDKGYYYFREIDGRVLLGGGRNLDFAGEQTTELALNERIQNDLEQKLSELILPGIPFSISQRWSGIMAFGETKFPIIKTVTPNVFGAFRMGGMGVALGSEAARLVAELVVNS